MAVEELKQLVCGGCLGYGFDEEIFWEGIARNPDYITYDCGSIDPGPFYLGEGVPFVREVGMKTDLRIILDGGIKNKIPIIFTTAGGAGADIHVEKMLNVIKEVAKEKNLAFKVVSISAEMDKEFIKQELKRGKISPLGSEKNLTLEDIDRTSRIVAQMGYEPILKALDTGADLILAGRCCDEMAGASFAIWRGFDVGLSLHMGKILECGSQCIERASGRRSGVLGIMRKDHFLIEPADPDSQATVESVSKHCAFEERHPTLIEGPEGAIDATQSKFEQVNPRVVKVTGSRLKKSDKYTLKLEGAAFVGYRTIIIGGNRSQEMIDQIDWCIQDTREYVARYFKDIPKEDYQLYFHVYGKDGVMADWEPVKKTKSHELGIVTEVVAKTPEISEAICHYAAGVRLHHMDYPGSLNKAAGNMAFMSSPLEFYNKAYEFSVHHLLEVDGDPCRLFPITVHKIG